MHSCPGVVKCESLVAEILKGAMGMTKIYMVDPAFLQETLVPEVGKYS